MNPTPERTEKTPRTENQPCVVPLIERLRSVPKDAREMIEVGHCAHRNIPYGAMCHEAANALASHAALVAQNEALRGALEGLLEWADTMKAAYEHPFLNDTALQNSRSLLTTTPHDGGRDLT